MRASTTTARVAPTPPAPAPRRTALLVVAGACAVGVGAFAGVLVGRVVPTGGSSSTPAWGVDATHALPAARFVRMHNTVCTQDPFRLGGKGDAPFATLPPVPHIAREDALQGNVSLNAHVGAAHAYCFALRVEGDDRDHSFRLGTAAEINALTAIVHLPPESLVLTYASSDGDDYELGQVRTTLRHRYPSPTYVDQTLTYSYDGSSPSNSAPPPPPPNPSPPKPDPISMQSFMGSDMETAYDELRVHPHVLAYCCAGVYTKMDSEGAS